MKNRNEKQSSGLSEIRLGLDDLIRQGARQVIQQAVEAELAQLLEQYENVKTLTGQRAVVRNGYLPERAVLTAMPGNRRFLSRLQKRPYSLTCDRVDLFPSFDGRLELD